MGQHRRILLLPDPGHVPSSGFPAGVVTELLAIGTFGADAIGFPWLAELAARALVSGFSALVVHLRPPLLS